MLISSTGHLEADHRGPAPDDGACGLDVFDLEPATGKPRGEPLRLEGINDFIFASPVGAAGRIYITSRDGTTVVLRHDRENATLAVNHLEDSFSASPALVNGELYLRGERFLYCIAEPEQR